MNKKCDPKNQSALDGPFYDNGCYIDGICSNCPKKFNELIKYKTEQ